MAIFRNIQISFWNDPKVVDNFTPEDILFYLYLLTNPHTNLCGCYEISKRQISSEIKYTPDAVDSLIDRFSSYHNLIRYSLRTKELLILNWHKHNWSSSPKFRTALMKEIDSVKENAFKGFLEATAYGNDTVSIPYSYSIDTTDTITITDTVTDSVSVKKNEKPQKHKYGECDNVLLSDDELEKLKEKFPDWQDRIDNLSRYLKQTGKRYASHYQTILNWARRDSEQPRFTRTQKPGDIHGSGELGAAEYEAIQRMLREG